MKDPKLPGIDEILQLPRLARLAYAARCARRAQPLLVEHWLGATAGHLRAIEDAIAFAEDVANTDNTILAADASAVADAFPAAIAFKTATDAFAVLGESIAFHAANAAAHAARAVYDGTTDNTHAAATFAGKAGVDLFLLRTDFDHLVGESRRLGWSDDTLVPSTAFPPPNQSIRAEVARNYDVGKELNTDREVMVKLRAFAKAGITANELALQLVEVYSTLNEYTLAKYGRHLSRDGFRRLILAHSKVSI